MPDWRKVLPMTDRAETQPDLFNSIQPDDRGRLEVPYNELADVLVRMKAEGVWTSHRMDVDHRRGIYVLHLTRISR